MLRETGGRHAVFPAQAVEQLPLEDHAYGPFGIDRRVEPALNQLLAAERPHRGEVGPLRHRDALPGLFLNC